MTEILHQFNFSPTAEPLPEGFSDEVYELCRTISCPEIAENVFNNLQPLLGQYRADQNLAIACGLLFERFRTDISMGDVWEELQKTFPKDATALRMLMRWCRRERRTEEGIAHVRSQLPDRKYSLTQAKAAIAALSELKAWEEIDDIMTSVLIFHHNDRTVRMAYIKALAEQQRFPEAALMAQAVEGRERMGKRSRELLETVERNARLMRSYGCAQPAVLVDAIVARAPAPRPLRAPRNLVLFTGQLGTGGAERQLTGLALAYRKQAESGHGPSPEVWVRHTNTATGADFFRPALEQAGIPTRVLSEEPEIQIDDLDGVSDTIRELLELLAPDLRRHIGQLVSMFRAHQVDVAYLWQDGGILHSALAAVIAGVPRIVTSFRGLPPNMRPKFFRSELPVLYAALARLPHVTFSANSRKAATAYEEWLGLQPGSIVVIPNAAPPILPDGDASDHAYWAEITARSEGCSKTVLGVFRFDANKRPLEWIETAARYLARNDDTRFVILGKGAEHAACAAMIKDRGLSDRIFLAGIRSNVGFYMHRADLVMHLARMEGLPNVLIEAQLAGTAVLATPAGGTDEVVRDGVTGVLLSSADELPVEELDRKLAGLLASPERLARLGVAASEHSRKRFSHDQILQRTTDLFLQTCADPVSPSDAGATGTDDAAVVRIG